jgi:hypothetical protein
MVSMHHTYVRAVGESSSAWHLFLAIVGIFESERISSSELNDEGVKLIT